MKILALLLVFIPAILNACTCVLPTFEEQMKKATAVFTGRVLQTAPDSEGRLRVDFTVSKKWKGSVGAKISVYTAADTSACGYPFQRDERYLVFGTADNADRSSAQNGKASTAPTGFNVSLCSLTKRVTEAGEELAKLDSKADVKIRRDPFTEMRGDRIVEHKIVPKALNITNAVIVGITKKSDSYVALIRATNNKVYFLKVGDKLHDGVVAKIDRNSVTFRQTRGSRSVLIRKELRPFPDE